MRTIEIRIVEPEHVDLHFLIKKLDEDLLERYPADEIFGVDFNDPRVREMLFVVAYADGIPAGCGAIRPLDATSTELKRFFVDREYRNQGIAGRILQFLEGQAREQSFKTIKLEAGTEQPEALQFYKKHGYQEIEKFGQYVECESSLCYEKVIQH